MNRIICLRGWLAVFTIVFCGCGSIHITLPAITPTSGSTGNTGSNTTGSEPHWGVQTKTSGCVAHDALPDSACTPGAVLATGTKDAICQSGYAGSVRNVAVSGKNQVYAE